MTLRIWGVKRKGALRLAGHSHSCQPSSTDMRGSTVAWRFYWFRWLILYSYHSASWEPQLLFACHHMDFVAAVLQFLTSQTFIGKAWAFCWGLVAAETRAYDLQVLPRVVVCCACAVLKVLPLPVECSTGCVGWGASLKGEEERGRGRE